MSTEGPCYSLEDVIHAVSDVPAHCGYDAVGEANSIVRRWGLPVYNHTAACRRRGCWGGWPDPCNDQKVADRDQGEVFVAMLAEEYGTGTE